jgi:release factor glutamine methyltransferase
MPEGLLRNAGNGESVGKRVGTEEFTIKAARALAKARLAAAGVEDAALDARLLVQRATGLDAAALAADPDRMLTAEQASRLDALAARRAAREPMSQILGHAGFWTIELIVTRDVLTPRPESETVIAAALEETRNKPNGRALDLGVGPGTLLFAVLKERPGWRGVGLDASAAALAVARANALVLGLEERADFVLGDWAAALDATRVEGPFDLVLANPPYVPSAEIERLAPEVRDFEPRLALDGGPDGLDAYRRIAPALPRLLAPDGVGVLEVGAGQGRAVAALIAESLPQAAIRIDPDLAGRDRAVVIGAKR